MRGRLINALQAEIGIEDPASMVFDDIYREKQTQRQETVLNISCQVEEPSWFKAKFGLGGLEEDGEIVLILHFADLETLGLLDTDGNSLINVGARLISLSSNDGSFVRRFKNPPGMYVIQAKESSWGLSAFNTPQSPLRNLLFLLFAPRRRQ